MMEYWQNTLLSTGNFLCSAPSMNSTMDFSMKPLEDGVVDSPLKKNVKVSIIYLASSLLATEVHVPNATMSLSDIVRLMQRKVYKDANYGT